MAIQTTDRAASNTTRPQASPRMTVWVELPQSGAAAAPSEKTPPYAADRTTWYDPAALYEEADRWDGLA